MRNYRLLIILTTLALIASACGLVPAAPAQPSATPGTPKATALSKLPDTWTPAPSSTPLPTRTSHPSATPTQDPENYQIALALPAETIPYPSSLPDRTGWKTVTGKTATIMIPPSFEVLDFAGTMMEMMVGLMEAFAQGFVDLAQDLGEELGATPQATLAPVDLNELPDFDFIVALEESTQSTIILVSEESGPDTTTEDLINSALSNFQGDFQVSSRQVFSDAPLPMERVILDVSDPELGPGKQVVYGILGDGKAWNLMFGVPAEKLDDYLPLFESVVDSLARQP